MALATAAESYGLVCESQAGAYLDVEIGYLLACDGQDAAAHAKFGLSVSYWTLDAVTDIHLYVVSDQPGAVVSPSAPTHLFSPVASVASNDVKAWVQTHLDDQACSAGCRGTFGALHVVLNVGLNGARQLDIYGYDA